MVTFDDLVSRLPADQRSIGAGRCYFGVPAAAAPELTVLDTMPPAPVAVSFLGGGEQAELVRAFTESPYAAVVESIDLGSSSYAPSRQRDHAAAVTALVEARLPQVQRLTLGVWDLFHNESGLHGHLGDITRLPNAMPSLENLALYGHFSLSEPLDLPRLRSFSVVLDDWTTGPNVPPLSQETVTRLLSSHLPTVEEIWLALTDYDDVPCRYRLPTALLEGTLTPRLTRLEVDAAALVDGEADRILSSRLARTARVDIDPGD